MSKSPRIRILWIDDREWVSGFPELQIPAPYSKWFEVVHPRSTAATAMSYTCARDFSEHFLPFWLEGKLDHFPAEIIATDYNLKKRAAASTGGQAARPLGPKDTHVRLTASAPSAHSAVGASASPDFDGLVIGTFYATLTHRHPAVLVSITNYPGGFSSEIDTLRDLISPLLLVARKPHSGGTHSGAPVWHNLPATERSWRNIIHAGLDPLRRRIAQLYDLGDILIPCHDLVRIINGATDGTVSLKSPHASRVLPLEGLFCDLDDIKKRRKAMQTWASDIVEARITLKHHDSAHKLARTLWMEYYNNDILIERHKQFSAMHASRCSARDPTYTNLADQFRPESRKTKANTRLVCTQNWGDIRMGSKKQYQDSVRRWAALFLIRWLLKRMLCFIKETNLTAWTRRGTATEASLYPTFEEDDILLLLFPVPESPFPLPWHCDNAKARDNLKGGWRRAMSSRLGFEPSKILDGSALTMGERQVLQGMAIHEDAELGDSSDEILEAWMGYEPARLFLFGSGGINRRRGDE